MDLPTVLAHALAHLLGFDHSDAGVMDDTLDGTTPLESIVGLAGVDNRLPKEFVVGQIAASIVGVLLEGHQL